MSCRRRANKHGTETSADKPGSGRLFLPPREADLLEVEPATLKTLFADHLENALGLDGYESGPVCVTGFVWLASGLPYVRVIDAP